MKKLNIQLTKDELRILAEHFGQDINYCAGGTFGNGEDLDNKKEYLKAKKILTKLVSKLYA